MLMDWGAACRRWHNNALDDLKQHGATPFMLRIYPYQTDNCAVWVEDEGLSPAARARLRVINEGLRAQNPAAVLASSDMWQASTKFFNHHGIQDLPFKERCKRYLEILNREYGGWLANVPADLKSEAVFTCIKGPRFMPVNLSTFYHREQDKIILDDSPDLSKWSSVITIVPDWWESVIQ
jgi:hypothetical protein